MVVALAKDLGRTGNIHLSPTFSIKSVGRREAIPAASILRPEECSEKGGDGMEEGLGAPGSLPSSDLNFDKSASVG